MFTSKSPRVVATSLLDGGMKDDRRLQATGGVLPGNSSDTKSPAVPII